MLRHLKPSASPHGKKTGAIYFEGTPLGELTSRDAASKIGFVMQSPDNQIVTDKVWHELAFGLESLGCNTPEIRLRVAEMASFFGIQTWFHKPVTELSGGQKQLLALASIMVMQPSALLLDEPTSQLDPIAAGEFLATVGKINRELGVTVILTEHRLEEAFPLSSRVIVLDEGEVIADGEPRETGMALRGRGHGMFLAMPAPMRVWAACEAAGECPVTVRDGAVWLSERNAGGVRPVEDAPSAAAESGYAVRIDGVWFKYGKNMPDVLKGLSFKARYGEISVILGGNGAGKTTALSLVAGLYKPYRGSVTSEEAVFSLPQNPQSLFTSNTLREDLLEVFSDIRISDGEKNRRFSEITVLCRLETLLDSHPYDLSGGEQQRAALAKVLLLAPRILLLDEPTKGLDAEFKQIFAAILRKLAESGAAIIMASHDVEFCAEFAERCALFFDGSIVTENAPREFFSGNSFYTTGANRMARGIFPKAVTAADIILALGGTPPELSAPVLEYIPGAQPVLEYITGAQTVLDYKPGATQALTFKPGAPVHRRPGFSGRQKLLVIFFTALILTAACLTAWNFDGFSAFVNAGNETISVAIAGAPLYTGIMLLYSAGIAGIVLTLTYKRETKPKPGRALAKKKLTRRTAAALVVVLLAVPLTVYAGPLLFGDRKYYFISLLIILETMLPFALVFENRKPQARELVVIAVLCAIAVAGRAAFFMLPQFKPVIALVIIAGVAFGGEAGFLVGAMSGFISNFFFGQGPWTPYQMFAFGIIGFLSGVLFRKGLLRRTPAALAVFGAFAAVIIYGGIMNPSFLMIYQQSPTREMLLTAYLYGLPFDLVHAAATVTFLAIISRPMLEKLDRIKTKYGLVE